MKRQKVRMVTPPMGRSAFSVTGHQLARLVRANAVRIDSAVLTTNPIRARAIALSSGKRPHYRPESDDVFAGITHVVYEYSNFVLSGEHLRTAPGNPFDVLVLNAFLLNCRQLTEFLGKATDKPDIKAFHYCPLKGFTSPPLPVWKKWKDAIDRQLAHISYWRVNAPEPGLSEPKTNQALLQELREAFRQFLSLVETNEHRDEYARQLAARAKVVGYRLP